MIRSLLTLSLTGCAWIPVGDFQEAVLDTTTSIELPSLDLELLLRPAGVDLCNPESVRLSVEQAFGGESLEVTVVVDGLSRASSTFVTDAQVGRTTFVVELDIADWPTAAQWNVAIEVSHRSGQLESIDLGSLQDLSELGYVDLDGDGYASGELQRRCDLPLLPSADDCDDHDPAVYPGAVELPADFVDSDCDGTERCFVDHDGDGDGDGAGVIEGDLNCTDLGVAGTGSDCDDADPHVFPGALERFSGGPGGPGGNGGALHVAGDGVGFSIEDFLIQCSADRGIEQGGGMYASAEATLRDGRIENCFANNGGALYTSQPTNLYGVDVIRNTSAHDGAGGVRMNGGSWTGGIVEGNTTTGSGGGLRLVGTVDVTDLLVRDNQAGENGGGIYTSGTGTFERLTIMGNTAHNSGGGIHNTTSSATSATHLQVEGNSSRLGAGIYTAGVLLLDTVNLRENTAVGGQGGGLYATGSSTGSIQHGNFVGNSTTIHGGGALLRGSSWTLSDTVFEGNLSDGRGGGIRVETAASLTSCTFTDNRSAQGGGLSFSSGMSTVAHSLFIDNQADAGAQINILDSATVAITGGSMVSNQTSVSTSTILCAGALDAQHLQATPADNDHDTVLLVDAGTLECAACTFGAGSTVRHGSLGGTTDISGTTTQLSCDVTGCAL